MKYLFAAFAIIGSNAFGYLAMADSNILSVKEAWARATPAGAAIGVAYMTFFNMGTTDDRLLNATTPIAAKVEFHSAANVDGVMQMRELSTITIPLREPTTLKPGAVHMMLIGLTQPLKQGQTFPLVLEFAIAGRVDVTVQIESVGAMGPAGASQP